MRGFLAAMVSRRRSGDPERCVNKVLGRGGTSRSVFDEKLAGAEGFEPSPSSLTVRCPTSWTTPQQGQNAGNASRAAQQWPRECRLTRAANETRRRVLLRYHDLWGQHASRRFYGKHLRAKYEGGYGWECDWKVRESKITEGMGEGERESGASKMRTKSELQIGKRQEKNPNWDYISPRCVGDFSKVLNRPSVSRTMTLWKCNQKIRGDVAIQKVLLETQRVKLESGSHNPECSWWTPRYSLPPGALTSRVHT
jgi:hypothetical protein